MSNVNLGFLSVLFVALSGCSQPAPRVTQTGVSIAQVAAESSMPWIEKGEILSNFEDPSEGFTEFLLRFPPDSGLPQLGQGAVINPEPDGLTRVVAGELKGTTLQVGNVHQAEFKGITIDRIELQINRLNASGGDYLRVRRFELRSARARKPGP